MQVRIPQYQHLPRTILVYDFEDIGLGAVLYFLWLIADGGWMMFIAIFAIPYFFHNYKAKMPRGYLKHVAYRLGFFKSKLYPPSAVRVHHE